MPVLAPEPDILPEDLLDGFADRTSDRRWLVLATRARHEKALARHLFARRIPFFLPSTRRALTYGRRRVTSRVPLFPGYVFLFGSEEERIASLTSNCVSRCLVVPDHPTFVFQLRQVAKLLRCDLPLNPESPFACGAGVRVREGVLAGLEGVVLRRQGRTRLLVAVDFIKRGASVEVDDCLLEPLT